MSMLRLYIQKAVICFFILSLCLHFSINAKESISIKSIPILKQMPSNSSPRIFQDKDGFLWFGTLDGLCRYDGYRLLTFRSDSNNSKLFMSNEITCIAEDTNNNLLIGTKKGLNILDKATFNIQKLKKKELDGQEIKFIYVSASNGFIWIATGNYLYRYSLDLFNSNGYREPLPSGSINGIYEDNSRDLWVMIWGNGLFKYTFKDGKFQKYPPIGHYNTPFRIYQDNKNNFWIGTWGDGLFRFYPNNSDEEKYHPIKIAKYKSDISENFYFSIVQDDQYGYMWFVSSSGLYVLKYTDENKIEKVDISNLTNESNNIFSEIIKDKTGNLWVGTFSEGAFIINFKQSLIKNFPIESIKTQIGITPNITTLFEDSDGDIWINQNRWGLGIFNPSTKNVKLFQYYPSLKKFSNLRAVSCISNAESDTKNIWVGLEGEPFIFVMNKNKGDIRIKEIINLDKYTHNAGYPRKFLTDRKGNTWIATNRGLLVKPVRQDTIIPVTFVLGEVTDITEDAYGNIWTSSKSSGVFYMTIKNNLTIDEKSIRNFTDRNSILNSNNTNVVHADVRGRVWIGTKEGSVIIYDIISNKFKNITSTFNMIDEGIFDIISDNYGHIWISTNKRVIEFNPQNFAIKEYSCTDDNILVNSFHDNSLFKNEKGDILYGGNRGITVFTPSEKLSQQAAAPKVFISDIKINNQSIYSDNNNYRYNSIDQTLLFNPDDKNIEIDFSSLNYNNSSKTRYVYKLEGLDEDWVYTAKNRQFAIYNQLRKGSYTFKVKATDENGLWSNTITTLKIYKKPAVYETWWAYSLYLLVIIIFVYFSYVRAKNRIKLRNDLKIAQIEKIKSDELTQTKLKYFTNISHDFLTPLTILSCLIDDAEMTYKSKILQFDSMRISINRLRRLLQQVLDFRKIESGNMKLKLSNGDIVMTIRDVCYKNFQPLIKKKNINLLFNASPLHIQAWFDADKIDKIIFNLLSNAFKYTPENGKIEVDLKKYNDGVYSHLVIKIKDSGIGISEEDINKIFNRFYSNGTNDTENSNGIGLNLTKDLVEIHSGSIQVESKIREGSLFTIDIPIDKEFYVFSYTNNPEIIHEDKKDILLLESSIVENISEIASDENTDKLNDMTILLVEDNEELLYLMKNILSKYYNIVAAQDGEEALSVVKENEINLIISDIMMPKMDGLELCRLLKSDIETSHIPIILLTAKSSTEDRIECYNAGADGYITKPFELKVLEARINSFIIYKKSKQQKFQSNKEINISTLEYPSSDGEFLEKAIRIIEQHLSNNDFDITLFAEKLYLSKSTLYRKIKNMTGLSPVEFIRNIRLKHACRILQNQSMPISEVAYTVGFSDPNYFTLCFKAEFNITPTDYRKNNSA